jgi:hypothetical protein
MAIGWLVLDYSVSWHKLQMLWEEVKALEPRQSLMW